MKDPKWDRHFAPPVERWLRVDDIRKEIGRGGVSVVYELVNPDDGTSSAIKIFNPDRRFDDIERLRSRFRLEQWMTARFKGFPGVLTGNFGEKDNIPYIVTSLYPQSLKYSIRTRTIPPSSREFMELAIGMLEPLTFLHANGIVHRDIKPDNILSSCRKGTLGSYVIGDYGIGLLEGMDYTRQTMSGDLMGSRDYIAPEQRREPSKASALGDIFSTGIVLYEFATGSLPSGDFIPLGDIAPHLNWATKLVSKMISQDPTRRPQSAPVALDLLVEGAVGEVLPSSARLQLSWLPLRILGGLAHQFGKHKDYRSKYKIPPYAIEDMLSYVCFALGTPYQRIVSVRPPGMAQPLSKDYLIVSEPPNAIEQLSNTTLSLAERFWPLIERMGFKSDKWSDDLFWLLHE